jgi:hypothetical protein
MGALSANIITEDAGIENAFPIMAKDGMATPITYDTADYKGVLRAIGDLQNDIDSVSGVKPVLGTADATEQPYAIVIGTLGKNKRIDRLRASHALDTGIEEDLSLRYPDPAKR